MATRRIGGNPGTSECSTSPKEIPEDVEVSDRPLSGAVRRAAGSAACCSGRRSCGRVGRRGPAWYVPESNSGCAAVASSVGTLLWWAATTSAEDSICCSASVRALRAAASCRSAAEGRRGSPPPLEGAASDDVANGARGEAAERISGLNADGGASTGGGARSQSSSPNIRSSAAAPATTLLGTDSGDWSCPLCMARSCSRRHFWRNRMRHAASSGVLCATCIL
mmetsp:Transcript_10073/g.30138  ORF Transcript_10073/g.30138 Transcript_10073/m.30138 type:complete len:223 (+) Transcript_10073:573-1241(+)